MNAKSQIKSNTGNKCVMRHWDKTQNVLLAKWMFLSSFLCSTGCCCPCFPLVGICAEQAAKVPQSKGSWELAEPLSQWKLPHSQGVATFSRDMSNDAL